MTSFRFSEKRFDFTVRGLNTFKYAFGQTSIWANVLDLHLGYGGGPFIVTFLCCTKMLFTTYCKR